MIETLTRLHGVYTFQFSCMLYNSFDVGSSYIVRARTLNNIVSILKLRNSLPARYRTGYRLGIP